MRLSKILLVMIIAAGIATLCARCAADFGQVLDQRITETMEERDVYE